MPLLIVVVTAVLLMCAAGCEREPARKVTTRPTPTSTPIPTATPEPAVAVATPIPEILWDERAAYEKEGQIVLFTDCGLYKGDTDELTGAKCEFKEGQWVLLEPKPEPGDNLIQDGRFDNLAQLQEPFTRKARMRPLYDRWALYFNDASSSAEVKLTTEHVMSPPNAVEFKTGPDMASLFATIPSFSPTCELYMTLVCRVKHLSGEGWSLVRLGDYVGGKWDYSEVTIVNDINLGFQTIVITKRIVSLFREKDTGQVSVFICCGRNSSIAVDDVVLVRGYFPMGFEF